MAIAEKLQNIINEKSAQATMTNYGLTSANQINSSTKFIDYPKYIFNAFLEALRTPDTLFTNLPKKSGSGANITLNDTSNAPMRITLGSTALEQETTTGKNLLEITDSNSLAHCSYVSGANTNQYKLLCTSSDMYVNNISASGVAYSKSVNGNLISCNYGETIYFDTNNTLFTKNYFTEFDENLVSLGYYNKYVASGSYTPTNANCKYVTFRFGYGTGATADTTYTLAPIVSKSSITSYEPYTNGASPTPSYPQDIHTISGSNTIEVRGKNKLGYPSFTSLSIGGVTFENNKGVYTIGGTTGTSNNFPNQTIDNYIIQSGDYIHYNNSFIDSHIGFTLIFSDNTTYFNSFASSTNRRFSLADYVGKTITGIRINYNTGYQFSGTCSPMICNISTATNFEEYQGLQTADVDLGDIQCGSIGNYENIPIRTSGKNLLNIPNGNYNSGQGITAVVNNGVIILNGTATANAFITANVNIPVKAQAYTLSLNNNATNNNVAARFDSNTMTTGLDTTNKTSTNTFDSESVLSVFAIRIQSGTTLNNFVIIPQFQEGSTALPYEPYGNGTWYTKKNINKIVLDGTELNWSKSGNTTFDRFLLGNNIHGIVSAGGYSNYFKVVNINVASNLHELSNNGNSQIVINFSNYGETTLDQFKTWLGNHNVIFEYVLDNPTYTPITGTLAEQLENVYQLMKSYKGQTNISQVNDDLSFNLSVQAIENLN